jgi:hypothetical protein|tara:strand:- start:53 stop:745 length:693 start_codon:yes stop_codon:yes gene_type:complete
MKVIYRISDDGYRKIKPKFISNEKCLSNFVKVFGCDSLNIIADNVSKETNEMILKYVPQSCIEYVSIGHGAGTFNLALDLALKFDEDEIIYFVENDYIHRPNSSKIIEEGVNLGATFISLYDNPDKYLSPEDGGNPYCFGGAEDTRVYATENTHWKITNSTTMTFAAKVSTLKRVEPILRKHTQLKYPQDFQIFVDLREQNELVITPIPGYSTHGESDWLSPFINWEEYV